MKLTLEQAGSIVQSGGVIAYPTEAVWGLGCDPWNEKTVNRVFTLKKRSLSKGMIVVASRMRQLEPLLQNLTNKQYLMVAKSWPGPVTWVVPDDQSWMPSWVKGNFSSIAIRVSAHPVVEKLCDFLGKPIISTSANLANEPAVVKQHNISASIMEQIDGVLDGSIGSEKKPSKIFDLASGVLLRS